MKISNMNQKIFFHLSLFLAIAFVVLVTGCAKEFPDVDGNVPLFIDSILPSSGSAGQAVLLYGQGFSPHASQNKVFFNGTPGIVDTNASFNVLQVYAPANGKTGKISIFANGDSATGPIFTYLPTIPAPVITNVVFNGVLIITGQHFDSLNSIVTIGGQVTGGFVYSNGGSQQSLSRASYTPPSSLDNPAPFTVTVKGVTSNSYPFLFYPVINRISPDTAQLNKPVTLTGALFGSRSVPSTLKAFYYDSRQNKVYMTPDPVITSWNTNTIQATIPDYSNYTIGISLINFYLEVNVSTHSTNKELLYSRQ
jgi:hypothetical protein